MQIFNQEKLLLQPAFILLSQINSMLKTLNSLHINFQKGDSKTPAKKQLLTLSA